MPKRQGVGVGGGGQRPGANGCASDTQSQCPRKKPKAASPGGVGLNIGRRGRGCNSTPRSGVPEVEAVDGRPVERPWHVRRGAPARGGRDPCPTNGCEVAWGRAVRYWSPRGQSAISNAGASLLLFPSTAWQNLASACQHAACRMPFLIFWSCQITPPAARTSYGLCVMGHPPSTSSYPTMFCYIFGGCAVHHMSRVRACKSAAPAAC